MGRRGRRSCSLPNHQVSVSEEGRTVLASTSKPPPAPRRGPKTCVPGSLYCAAPPFSLFHRARRILSFRKRENGGCITQPSLSRKPPRPLGRVKAPPPAGEKENRPKPLGSGRINQSAVPPEFPSRGARFPHNGGPSVAAYSVQPRRSGTTSPAASRELPPTAPSLRVRLPGTASHHRVCTQASILHPLPPCQERRKISFFKRMMIRFSSREM